ncbi:hypothetical protein [Deinococcus xianganensis]|uniref:Uncharacterized protein n=1 Tax=Deinococcus xianganensis TaxID=1507289 RepID=A0A6I4YF71_9DEIO|nr:hypothetical protein [Deinococcus xianganensis]MXV18606.1 hypothetical protein [Deinococcus xianganensis]
MDFGTNYQRTAAYDAQAVAVHASSTISSGTPGGPMEWLVAVGALASPVASIVDSVTGTGKAKAEAAEAAANAQTAAIQAQIEHERLASRNTQQMLMYGLIAVGVVAAGVVAYRAVA